MSFSLQNSLPELTKEELEQCRIAFRTFDTDGQWVRGSACGLRPSHNLRLPSRLRQRCNLQQGIEGCDAIHGNEPYGRRGFRSRGTGELRASLDAESAF